MKNEKKQTGKVNYIWVLAGAYLIYLAYKLLRGLSRGETSPGFAIGFAVLFVVVGAMVLYREWKAYKFGLEHIDDPDTWSDEEEDAELAELTESIKSGEADDAEEDDMEHTDDEPEDEEEEQI